MSKDKVFDFLEDEYLAVGEYLSLEQLQEAIPQMEQQLSATLEQIKLNHNTIMELKGNIRIFCRVRPFLPQDERQKLIVSYPDSIEVQGRAVSLKHKEREHVFIFDRVFNHEATQEEVFIEVSQFVQSALDGHKVCIFAYGQTGSGKTYTMMGMPENPERKGMISRSLEQIFEATQSLSGQGWNYTVQVSIVEIYNEHIIDLLSSRDNSEADEISEWTVYKITDVNKLLKKATKRRSVGKTTKNKQSSKSHLVFTARLLGVKESTGENAEGVLNLIDLAGNESLSTTEETTREQEKETKAINKSLSTLNRVIIALAEKDDFVPFRESKLTNLLKPCLGGDAKTLMLITVSPDSSSAAKSYTSLQFAKIANGCGDSPKRHGESSRR